MNTVVHGGEECDVPFPSLLIIALPPHSLPSFLPSFCPLIIRPHSLPSFSALILSAHSVPSFSVTQATSAYLEAKNVTHLFPDGSWERIMIAKCRNPQMLSITPKKAEAVLFYSQLPDGQPDRTSLHGGCPVLTVRDRSGPSPDRP